MWRTVVFLSFAIIGAVAIYNFVAHQQLTSAQVDGISMSPSLCGRHYVVNCARCGFVFRLAASPKSDAMPETAICPMCGEVQTVDLQHIQAGDQVFLTSANADNLKRWKIVAARDPRYESSILVKRIAGLPNELLCIRDGDLWINGKVMAKSLPEFRTLSTLISDSHRTQFLPQREVWKYAPETDWKKAGAGWIHSGRSSEDGFLIFHPPSMFPGAPGSKSYIRDYNWFDQASNRNLNVVADAMVAVAIASASGEYVFSVDDGWHDWDVRLSHDEQTIVLWRDGEKVAQVPEWKNFRLVEVGSFDRHFVVGLGGEEVLRVSILNDQHKRRLPDTPFRIRAEGLVEIESISVYRDIYYTNAISHRFSEIQLGNDEFFLLGDYSPRSTDSRHDQIGPIIRSHVLGVLHENP